MRDGELSFLAGEYVLGVLPAEDAREVERRMASEPELRASVEYWQRKLSPLDVATPAMAPDPSLWSRIARDVAPPARAVVAASPPLWERVGFLRWAGAAGWAASLLLATSLLFAPGQPTWTYSAVLEAPDRAAGWLVQVDAGGGAQLTPLTRTELPAGRSLQFWTLADPQQGPVSLGLVPADRAIHIPASRLPGVKRGQLFEITQEPAGGSPLNRPSGPILFKGYLQPAVAAPSRS